MGNESLLRILWRRNSRQLFLHLQALACIAVTLVIVTHWWVSYNRYERLYSGYVDLLNDQGCIALLIPHSVAGRYPYEIWRDHSQFLGFGFLHGQCHSSNSFTPVTFISIPYWPLAIVSLALTILAIRRARVFIPDPLRFFRDKRRGFEPIMNPLPSEPRKEINA